MGLLSWNKSRQQYISLSDTEERTRRASRQRSWLQMIVPLIALTLVASVAFFAGSRWSQSNSQSQPYLSVVSEVFRYNRTFGERPSNETNRAWHELLPSQAGFFRHPTVAPKRSAFAVFHQLHCLDGIRQGYWIVHDAATNGSKLAEDDLPFMASPSHIRHCIDLLRHSLMCQPDTTVEVKDEEKGGVTGFGTEHQCRDWSQLVKWTSEWEAYEQDSPARKAAQEYNHGHAPHTGEQ